MNDGDTLMTYGNPNPQLVTRNAFYGNPNPQRVTRNAQRVLQIINRIKFRRDVVCLCTRGLRSFCLYRYWHV